MIQFLVHDSAHDNVAVAVVDIKAGQEVEGRDLVSNKTLKAKAASLQNRESQAQEELQNSVETLKSTAAHVQQQIGEKLVQVVEQVRAQRRAAIVVSKNSILANDGTLDVTSEVLASLNQQLASVSVTPLQQQRPQQQQPQGR